MSAVLALRPAPKMIYMDKAETSSGAGKFAVSCSSCNLRELCLPGALAEKDRARAETLVYARRRLKRGEAEPEDQAAPSAEENVIE